MKLIYLKNKEDQIINDIRNKGGEITSEVEQNLEVTQKEIIKSIDAYANVIKKSIKTEKQYWTDRKKEIDVILKRIADNEDNLKQQLHSISTEVDLIGEEYTIKPDHSSHKTVNQDLVDPTIGEYTVQMSSEAYLRHFIDEPDDCIKVTRKVLLKDLPEGHEAIEETLTPTVKITKTK